MYAVRLLLSVLAVAAASCCRLLYAADFSLSCASELQTDFNGGVNFVNMLRTGFSFRACKCFGFEAAALSTVKTLDGRLADDMQVFSNIEEDNVPFALSVFGMSAMFGRSYLFFGIRNLNEDYFVSPCTSFFTNSSCGIFPTISAGMSVPNYPVAAVGMDYRYVSEHWSLSASLYNGEASSSFSGGSSVFRLCPLDDGLFGISSVTWHGGGSFVNAGVSVHCGRPDVAGSAGGKAFNVVLWGYLEQRISGDADLLLQCSLSPVCAGGCRGYAGAGVLFGVSGIRTGIFADCACFSGMCEWAGEITCRIPFAGGYVQPAVHFMLNGMERAVIGLVRVCCEL